jgi:hypothetical protein
METIEIIFCVAAFFGGIYIVYDAIQDRKE